MEKNILNCILDLMKNIIGKKNAHLPKYWRIRHGAKDSDTSAAISLILATALQNKHQFLEYQTEQAADCLYFP